MSLTTSDMGKALARHFDCFKNEIFPNVFLSAGWEADLYVCRPSGFADEVEIKVSRADFRAEFREKGFKHEWLVQGVPRHVDGRGGSVWTAKNAPVMLTSDRDPHAVRRYWMVFPSELGRKLLDDVPAHAGVLAVEEDGWRHDVRVLREAPVLKMARKITDEDRARFLRSVYFRFWKMRTDGQLVRQMFDEEPVPPAEELVA